ncbi:MAG: Hpt domain-containing protein, partial [Xanthomonadaceae bacterium]|nr:Hpt domain-containing protein [Xanthomonadaceae bacterium]
MRLQDDLDFTTLNWVKQELDETLKQARQALEAYVDDPADASLMRFCAGYLHQVQGTLRMVELYGAAMVVEEMERVANALLEGQVRQRDDAYSVLMRGIVQLPDYLERLQGGHKDIPIVLLPLLNDLRACRGEKLLSESVLFSPDLAATLPPSAGGAARATPDLELRAQVARMRSAFQVGLLHWFRNNRPEHALEGMARTLEALLASSTQEEARRLWWIAGGVVEALRDGALEAGASLKSLFGRVDREIKRLADLGEGAFRVEPPRELSKSLLYYLAHSHAAGPRSREVKRTFKLDTLLPTEQELTHAKGALGGRNRALLDTVSAAIKDDLMRVKDALDLHLRNPGAAANELGAQAEVLDRVADTLGMLGLGVPRRVVQEQRAVLNDVASGSRPADEGTLLDIAGALLYVEASLDDNIDSLGASADLSAGAAPATGAGEIELPQAEVRRILDAVMKEAQENLRKAKEDVVAFVEAPWDHAKVERIPALLEEIAGAMRILALEPPAELLDALGRFVEVELIRLKRVPTQDQMDRLADTLASIEYYVESARDQRAGRERILDVTRASLEALGYWPVPEDTLSTAPNEIDEVAGIALEAAPPAPAAAATDLDPGAMTLRFDTPVATGAAALRGPEPDAPANAADLPTLELPSESLDDFIARLERGEESPQVEEPAVAVPAATAQELSSVVDIHPGTDASDLLVGRAGDAPAPAPAAQDLGGLRLAETGALAPPAGEPEPEFDWVEIEEEVEEPAAATAEIGAFETVSSDEIDDEIRGVFVEEVQEEIDNLRRQFPAWRGALADLEQLKPIRRSFHTLKGSGRLVGAMVLGEFSWKVENMLNRVLDRTIQPGPAVVDVLEHAIAALPPLLSALRGEGAPRVDFAAIQATADRVAAGEDARVPQRAPATVKVKRTRRVQVPRPKPEPVAAPVELTSALDLPPLVDPVPAASSEVVASAPTPSDEVVPETALPEIAILETEDAADAFADLGMPVEAAVPEPASPVIPVSIPYGVSGTAVMPLLDPMLLEILRSEVQGHLETIDGWLAQAQASPSAAPESLLRAVHTMHGAISMADVPVVTELVGPLEGYIKRLRASGEPVNAAGVAAIADASRLVGDIVRLLDAPGAPLPDGQALVARLSALRDGLPEPQSALSLFSLAEEPLDADEPTDPASTATDAVAPEAAAEAPAIEDDWMIGEAATELVAGEPVIDDGDNVFADLEALLAPEAGAGPVGDEAALLAAEEPPLVLDEAGDELALALEMAALEPASPDAASPGAIEEVSLFADAEPLAEASGAIEVSEPDADAVVPAPVPVPAPPVEPAAPAPRAAAPAADDVDPDGPLVLPDMDEDLIEIFVEEGNDLLDKADTLVARLRESPNENEAIVGLQRQLHTIKGNARAVGLTGIGDLSHVMESLLEAVVGERMVLGRPAVEQLERGFDRLHRMVARVARRQAVGIPELAIARFEALVAGEPMPGDAPAPTPAEAPAPVVPAAPVAAAPTPAPAP